MGFSVSVPHASNYQLAIFMHKIKKLKDNVLTYTGLTLMAIFVFAVIIISFFLSPIVSIVLLVMLVAVIIGLFF